MGIETILFAAFTGLKAISQMNAAEKQAKAAVREGALAAENRAKEIRYKAARQTSSFLTSGLTLEGTPMDVLNETYATGQADITNIIGNANIKSKNAISAGRSAAIGTIASGFGNAALAGSAGSMFSTATSYLPESASFALNEAGFGNLAYESLMKKDLRG